MRLATAIAVAILVTAAGGGTVAARDRPGVRLREKARRLLAAFGWVPGKVSERPAVGGPPKRSLVEAVPPHEGRERPSASEAQLAHPTEADPLADLDARIDLVHARMQRGERVPGDVLREPSYRLSETVLRQAFDRFLERHGDSASPAEISHVLYWTDLMHAHGPSFVEQHAARLTPDDVHDKFARNMGSAVGHNQILDAYLRARGRTLPAAERARVRGWRHPGVLAPGRRPPRPTLRAAVEAIRHELQHQDLGGGSDLRLISSLKPSRDGWSYMVYFADGRRQSSLPKRPGWARLEWSKYSAKWYVSYDADGLKLPDDWDDD